MSWNDRSKVVPCPCSSPVECDWCCGSGRVTRRVRDAMDAIAAAGSPPVEGQRCRATGRFVKLDTGEVLVECRWDDGTLTWSEARGWPMPKAMLYIDKPEG